jgi:hypothetical protein
VSDGLGEVAALLRDDAPQPRRFAGCVRDGLVAPDDMLGLVEASARREGVDAVEHGVRARGAPPRSGLVLAEGVVEASHQAVAAGQPYPGVGSRGRQPNGALERLQRSGLVSAGEPSAA